MCTQPLAVATTNSACVGNVTRHGAGALPLPVPLTVIVIDTVVSAAPDNSVCVTFTSTVGTPNASLLMFKVTVTGATSNVEVVGCGVHAGATASTRGVYVIVRRDTTA